MEIKSLTRFWWWMSVPVVLIVFIFLFFFSKKEIQLTAEEQRWLAEHQTIRLAPNPNFAPFEFFQQDGTYTGYTSEFIKLIEQRLGITFTIVRYKSQYETLDAVKDRSVDLVTTLSPTPTRLQYLVFSKPLIELHNVIVVRSEDRRSLSLDSLAGKKVVVTRGNFVYEDILQNHPTIQLLPVSSGLESLYEISFGRGDAAIMNIASASYNIEKHGFSNLRVAGKYDIITQNCLAVRSDWPIFSKILDKALASISLNQRSKIAQHWLRVQIDLPWWDRIPWQWIAVFFCCLVILVVVGVIWNRSLNHQVQRKTKELQQELLERKKIETALYESEEKFRRIFDLSPVGTVMVGLDRKYIRCNTAYLEFIGYSEEELKGKTFLEVTHPEDKEIGSAEIEALIAKQIERAQIQKRYVRKDGTIIWGEVTMRLMFDENRQPLYFLTIILDITERKRADENTQHRTKELAALHNVEHLVNASLSINDVTEAALQGILSAIEVDLAFLFFREGDALLLQGIAPEQRKETFGKIPNHKVGECMCGLAVRNRTAIYSRDIFKDLRCTWEECKKAGLTSFAALPLFSGNDVIGVIGLSSYGERDYESSSAYLETLAGTIAIGIKNAQLYSTIKQAQEALSKSQEELQSIFRASPVGIGVVINRIISAANDELCSMTGYSREELLHQSSRILYPTDEDYLYVGKEKYRQISEEGTGTVETRWQRKDGKIIEVLLSSTPIDPTGIDPRVTFTALDITERKQLTIQLIESQKMESLGTLAGGVAHDFNNLLNIIMGYAGLLEKHSTNPDKFKRSIEAILKAGERATSLVRQILTFARRTEFQKTPLNINELIQELASMVSETFPKTIEISTDLYRYLSPILGDRNQLHQALLNLAVNARDAMPEGGKLIFRTTFVEEEQLKVHFPKAERGNYICLIVQDTGLGMNQATLERIYEPFYTTKEFGKGTGLGLSVVYGIVASMQGFIDVQSIPGQGTTFLLYLPAITVEREQTKVDTSKYEIQGGDETILIVEDEEATQDLLIGGLETNGYHVLIAKDGEEAVGMYRMQYSDIDLVLSDLGLPKMNGYECYREMKKINPNVNMILASGFFDPTEKAAMHESGIRMFVQKPYHLQKILMDVRGVLDKEKQNN